MTRSLPSGRYLSASGVVRADTGGQTRAMLMRSRLIGAAIGAPVDILSFDPSRRYAEIRRALYASGQLTPDMRLLNLYEHYREHGWGDEAGTGRPLPDVGGLQREEVTLEDGTPWRTSYRDTSGRVVLNDFRRPDGTVYLRAEPYGTTLEDTLPSTLNRVAPSGEVLGSFSGLSEWYHRWIGEITDEDERTFLFIDSRYLAPLVAPIDDPTVHLIYVLHNCHLAQPRTWDAPVLPDYQRVLDSIADLDAFVTLTARQAEDIRRRWGRRPNVYTVSNPVERPSVPDPLPPRDPRQVSIVARLERQKRLHHAILVMKRVVRQVPDARLDIYGSGSLQASLQALIDEHRLGDSVRLRGHQGSARDTLWSASAFLLTSTNEGYPLATLESLSRGCPVVSYDIPYGPSDQITDGVDGYLVADGKVAAAARKVVALLSSPDLVARMSEAARRTAARHGVDDYLGAWGTVLDDVVRRAPHRTRLRSATATITVTPARSRRLSLRRRALRVVGRLTVEADARLADPREADVSLVAVDTRTGSNAVVPVTVERNGWQFDVEGLVDPRSLLTAPDAEATLEIRFSWENSYWATPLRSGHRRTGRARTGRPQAGESGSGQPRTGQPRTGQPRTGQPRAGHLRAGQPRTGRALPPGGTGGSSDDVVRISVGILPSARMKGWLGRLGHGAVSAAKAAKSAVVSTSRR